MVEFIFFLSPESARGTGSGHQHLSDFAWNRIVRCSEFDSNWSARNHTSDC